MSKKRLPIRADSDSGFYRRFILMGIGALAFAGWCLYDGIVAWPEKNRIWAAYEAIPEPDRPEQWPTVAAENGWSSKKPTEEKYKHTDAEIQMQYFMAVPISLVGLWFLFGVFRARGTWIEATKEGVTSSWGQGFAWADVQRLDKKKWRSKGIAKVRYSAGKGAKTFVIDDYKFHREPTDAILSELEEHIDENLIMNGPTEKEFRAAEKAKAAAKASADVDSQQEPTPSPS